MREAHMEGTIFKVVAKIKDTEREPHIYTSWQWNWETLSEDQAAAFIQRNEWYAPDPKN